MFFKLFAYILQQKPVKALIICVYTVSDVLIQNGLLVTY